MGLVALPRRADGLPQLEKTLSPSRVSEWLSRLAPHEVDVTSPRFRMTAEAELHVSHGVHKAFVDVNEKGTEAAASAPWWWRRARRFFFLIRDTRTGSILFAGRLTDPRSR